MENTTSYEIKTTDLGNGMVEVVCVVDFDKIKSSRKSGDSSYAQDEDDLKRDVDVPFFKCRAADPMRCRFHGPSAIKAYVEAEIKKRGIKEGIDSAGVTVERLSMGRVVIKTSCPRESEAAMTEIFAGIPGTGEPGGITTVSVAGTSSLFTSVSKVDMLDKDAGKDSDKDGATEHSPEAADDSSPKWTSIGDFMLDASKTVSKAAKTINRRIDDGSFRANEAKVDAALAMKDGVFAVFNDESAGEGDHEQADRLLEALDDIEKSKANGFRDRIGMVPMYTPSPGSAAASPDTATAPAEMTDDEAKAISDDGGDTAAFLRAMAVDVPEGDLRDAVIAKLAEVDALDRRASEIVGGDKGKPSVEPKTSPSTSADPSEKTGGIHGFGMVEDGDDAKTLNEKREKAGLKRYATLEHLDDAVNKRQERLRKMMKEVSETYGDPELDISDPKVFAEVQKNWETTVKSIVDKGRIATFIEPSSLFGFISSGTYSTAFDRDGERIRNFAMMFKLSEKDYDEAPLSATLVSSDEKRSFATPCRRRFGPVYIEWKKDTDLVPLFSNCDVAEPATQDHGKLESKRTYIPTLVSSPKLCSLSAMCTGRDDIRDMIGHKSASGSSITSYLNAVKLLRKGPIEAKDAADFDRIVNGADKSPYGGIEFGWNEMPLIGKGTTDKVAAIHIDSESWEAMSRSDYTHGTTTMTASELAKTLRRKYGPTLAAKGIKVILDGKEVEL